MEPGSAPQLLTDAAIRDTVSKTCLQPRCVHGEGVIGLLLTIYTDSLANQLSDGGELIGFDWSTRHV